MKTLRDRAEDISNFFRNRPISDIFLLVGSLFAALFQEKAKKPGIQNQAARIHLGAGGFCCGCFLKGKGLQWGCDCVTVYGNTRQTACEGNFT